MPYCRRRRQAGNSKARCLLEQEAAGAMGTDPQAPRIRSLPAHAPRQRRRDLPNVPRADPEYEAGLPGFLAQHGLVHQLSHWTVEPAVPCTVRLQLVSLLIE